jgi:CrcB protein
MTAVLIALGGGLGAVARWGIVSLLPKNDRGFPTGITVVNVVGSFLLGFVVGFVSNRDPSVTVEPLTVGVLGGFTTFSTWMVDIDEAPRRRTSGAIVVIPLILGFAAAAAGLAMGLHQS